MILNIEKAMLNPADFFATPNDVCSEGTLTWQQKVKILRRWEYDARELQVADEENMGGGPPDRLRDILLALRQLGAEMNSSQAPPTKQGGH